HPGIGPGQSFATEHPGKLSARQVLAKPGFFRPLADNAEAEIAEATILHFLLSPRQQRNVLLHAETADEAEDNPGIRWIAIATVRAKQLRIDATLHQVAAATGPFLKKEAKVEIGSEQYASRAVKARRNSERRFFNKMSAGGGTGRGQLVEKPVGASRCILMDVG